METISTCIIAKNENKNIKEVITQAKAFSDEIIVIDNDSDDGTFEIARDLGARVAKYQGDKEYEQRNMYLGMAKMKWVFVIDADERINGEQMIWIKRFVLENASRYKAYQLPIMNFYGEGKWANTTTVRMFLNAEDLFYEKAEVHTSILTSIRNKYGAPVTGKIGILGLPVYHLDGIQRKRSEGKREKYLERVQKCIGRYKGSFLEMKFHNYLGFEYVALGEYEKAFQEFEFVSLHGEPTNILPTYFMARTRLMQDRLDEAEKYIERYLANCNSGKYPFTPEVLKERTGRGIITKADILARKGDNEGALGLIDTLPESASMLVNKYFLKKKMGDLDVKLLFDAVEMNPYMHSRDIYVSIKRPNIYEFQTDFINIVEDLEKELKTNHVVQW